MNHFLSSLLFLLSITLQTTSVFSQKVEIEKRISKEAFPKQALQLVETDYPEAKRLKFYRERSADSTTFEAKFCFEKHRYSVEFDPEGELLDIEKKVKFKTLPEPTKKTIEAKWTEDFKRFRVSKCQEQSSSNGIRYEIEVKGKSSTGTDFYEYLFASDGTFIQKQKIVLRPSDMSLY